MRKKPFVFSNLAVSIDGKIATASREPFHLGTPYDRDMMQVLRKRSDVVIMGASTLRSHQRFCGLREAHPRRQPANAILTTNGRGLSPAWAFFRDPTLRRLIFHTSPLPARLARELGKTCELIRLNGKSPVATQVVRGLTRRGYARLLVEGGGSVMWDFASRNLIDEYHVTVTPRILGGTEAPTLVDGAGFDPRHSLKLTLARCRRVGDELYLTYARSGRGR